jgi:hypothetical protein
MGKRKPAKTGRAAHPADGDDALDQTLAEIWETIAAGDVLRAEQQVSAMVSLPLLSGGADEESEILVDALIDAAMQQQYGPVGAAFLRLLMSLGPRVVKRAASTALAELTDEDVYPPEWVTGIGKVVPGQAWRAYDVFGDRETVIVTFSYPGESEHGLLVGVNLAASPTVSVVGVSADAANLLKMAQEALEPYERFEEIPLADARRRIEGPLADIGDNPYIELDLEAVMYVPVARSRMRRLPSGAAEPATTYTAGDRTAAVDEFLRSSWVAEAGDPVVARFWAEVLTGYSGRRAGQQPGLVGPYRLAVMLLGHAANTFTLTAAQRAGMQAAVTAWVRWAAAYRDLGEAATDHLLAKLPEIFEEFPAAYDDPVSVANRAYVRDVAASDADAAWLDECRTRRELAAPRPEGRDAALAAVDATTPEGRGALTEDEFASCAPDGAAGEKFLATAKVIVEELWHDDPPATWQAAENLLAKGLDEHDVIHRLVESRDV